MPIIASSSGGGSFTPAPAGTFSAVCVDVVDLGVLETTYSGKTKRQHKIYISWQIDCDETREDGKPFLVSKRYTLSLHEKASLRADLEAWRGRVFNDEELAGFDVEVLLGKGCYLNVVHNNSGGKIYANVRAIMRLPKGAQAPEPRDYIRVKDRPTTVAAGEAHGSNDNGPDSEWPEISDDDVPF